MDKKELADAREGLSTTDIFEKFLSKCDMIRQERTGKLGDVFVDEGFDGLVYDIRRKYLRIFRDIMRSHRMPNPDDLVDIANYAGLIHVLMVKYPEKIKDVAEDLDSGER